MGPDALFAADSWPRSRVIVCDSGTGSVKAGWAGDALPRAIVPCVCERASAGSDDVGLLKDTTSTSGRGAAVAAAAAAGIKPKSRDTVLSYPMRNGVVQDWDGMQQVWSTTWQTLGCDPRESRVLLTDPALNPTANRQRVLEVMLETYGFQGVNIQVQAVLSLYAHGLRTGVVLDAGDGVSHAVSVVEGYAYGHLTQRLNIAGRHVTEHLLELLQRRGHALSRATDLDAIRGLKEAHCYVALDYERELKLAKETTCLVRSYTLPDGRIIKVGAERCMAPEVLFNPSLMDSESPGLAGMVFKCINECDIDNRRQLYDGVVLSGGSTMYPGLPSRMEKELKKLYLDHVLKGDTSRLQQRGRGSDGPSSGVRVAVRDCPQRKHMVFRGAAVLAEIMREQPDFWVGAAEYAEDPHRALAKACPSHC